MGRWVAFPRGRFAFVGCELEVADAMVAGTKQGSCREKTLDVTAALQLHSIKRRSRCTAVFPGVSVLSKPTPALSKCLKLKCRVTSQAGRREFESRLPLHLFNNLERIQNQALLRLLRFFPEPAWTVDFATIHPPLNRGFIIESPRIRGASRRQSSAARR